MGFGYVNAEAVIGVRNPVYDEDRVAHETVLLMRLGPRFPLTSSARALRDIGNYECASSRMIESRLAKLR